MSLRRATAWSLIYIAAAVAFGVGLGALAGWSLGAQFFAGYVVEKSLSVDNLFVFVVIVGAFSVPPEAQPRALSIGIGLALVLRALLIAAGAVLIDAFSFTFVIFGAGLIVTAIQLVRHRHKTPSVAGSPLLALARRRLPLTDTYDGRRILTRARGGRRRATPLLLVLLAIATADVVFAFDSIPAVYGVTTHPLIVVAANVFALLGLRPLFFLVSGLLRRLVFLSLGLAAILAFIGVKLVLHYAHGVHGGVPEISTGASLAVIVLVLAVTTVASLRRTAGEGDRRKPPPAPRPAADTR